MKKKIFRLCFVIFLANIYTAQSQPNSWTETSVTDFSDNQLDDLIITNISGGEVQLPPPISRITDDKRDENALRFAAFDSDGNYVKVWQQGGNCYAKKFDADGNILLNVFQVNEIDGGINYNRDPKVAMLKDGTFLVTWTQSDMLGQIYDSDGVKLSNNFIINDTTNFSTFSATPIANHRDNNFIIVYPLKTSNYYKLHLQNRNLQGKKIGETTLLNPQEITFYEFSCNGASNDDGFWLVWDGANGNSSWDVDVYLRQFNYDGLPASDYKIVNQNHIRGQNDSFICFDDVGNFFVVWTDERDAKAPSYSAQLNIYGQIFNNTGERIENNIKLNQLVERSANSKPYITCTNNVYQISWKNWDQDFGERTFASEWKSGFTYSGSMISNIFDGGPGGCSPLVINWNSTQHTGSDIKFRLRSGNSVPELESSFWYGPDDTSGYYVSGNTAINERHQGDRYIQYKSYFNTSNGNSAVLNSILISYASFDNIAPATPQNFSAYAHSSTVSLSWTGNSESDLSYYLIYKGSSSNHYDNDLTIKAEKNVTHFSDENVSKGKTYYYAIAAVDSSHNQSYLSAQHMVQLSGTNIYVDDNASVNGDGSAGNPYNTIMLAIKNALDRDTIRVAAGYYNEEVILKNGVSLIGTDATKCTIDNSVTAADSGIIKGLTITGSIFCNSVSPTITENIFRGTKESYYASINVTGHAAPILSKNLINECEFAIELSDSSNTLLKNNIIIANELGIQAVFYAKFGLINNTIISLGYGAVNLAAFNTASAQNNIIIGRVSPTRSENVVLFKYNNIADTMLTDNNIFPKTNIFTNPKFINYDLLDFHLLSSSPCKDTGNPDPLYNDTDGSRNDMGAYGGPDPIYFGAHLQLTKSITLTSNSAFPGDNTHTIVSLDTPVGLLKALFDLEFDNTLLSFENAELTASSEQFNLQVSNPTPGKVHILMLGENAMGSKSSSEILKFNFMVKEDVNPDDASPLMLKNVTLFDNNNSEIFIRSITDGTFLVNPININHEYIYVDNANEGTEDGSWLQPFNTITEAIAIADSGDSIFVKPGLYKESIVMKENIHLLGAGANVTTIQASDFESVLWFDQVKNATVKGFTIKSTDPGFSLIDCNHSSPIFIKNHFESAFDRTIIFCSDSSKAKFNDNYFVDAVIILDNSYGYIQRNIFEGSYFAGVGIGNKSAPLISDNIFINPTRTTSISSNDAGPVIRNNIFYSTNNISIAVDSSPNMKILNNIIKDNGQNSVGILIKNTSDISITNNTIDVNGFGIKEENAQSNIQNNIIVNSYQTAASLLPETNNDFNDYWNNTLDYSEATLPGLHDINLDPLFRDYTNDDLRLSENSSCINAGNPDTLFNDIDGTRNDMGAFGGPYGNFDNLPLERGTSLALDSLITISSDTFRVELSGYLLQNIVEYDITLKYNPALIKPVDAQVSTESKSFSLEKNYDEAGTVNFHLINKQLKNLTEGHLLELYFVVITSESVNTIIHFENARVRDITTYEQSVENLADGKVQIIINNIDQKPSVQPIVFKLYNNYPNPFNPVTKICFDIPKTTKVTLKIYDVLGREVVTLVNKIHIQGKYEIDWDASKYASGIYFYVLQTDFFTDAKKLILLK